MELLFIFAEECGPLKNQLVTFCNDLKFKMENLKNGKRSLIIENNDEFIPGLWHKNIVSVSGIFGKNGSGKTSILKGIIQNINNTMTKKDDPLTIVGIRYNNNKVILWFADKEYKDNTEIINRSRICNNEIETEIYNSDKFRNRRLSQEYINGLSIIYYTPGHWRHNIYEIDSDNKFIHDISTNTLLIKDLEIFSNGSDIKPGEVIAHRFQSMIREITFLTSSHEEMLLFENLPKCILIKTNNYEGQRFKNESIGNGYEDERAVFDWIYTPSKLWTGGDNKTNIFKCNIYKSMIMNFVLNTVRGLPSVLSDKFSLRDIIRNINKELPAAEQCLEFLGQLKINDGIAHPFIDKISNMENFVNYIEKDLDNNFIETDDGYLGRIIIRNNIGRIKDFFYKYSNTIIITDYLVFDWYPALSSGQQSMLTMYARLYDLANKPDLPSRNKPSNAVIKDNVILIMDEADSYFHPSWQKELYNRILNLIPEIYPGKKVQIIFAANNPYQLSDMFNHQVNFLVSKKDEEEYNVTIRNQKTFGGNIHYLLADSFFMGQSLIGCFAEKKIKQLISWLNEEGKKEKPASEKEWPNYENAYKFIEQIGEPILKEKLRDMLMARFPGHARISILKQRLEETNKRQIELINKLKELEVKHD